MNLSRLGHAVVVNNVASEMQGSQKDVAALKATIGFDVHIYNDCSAQVIYFRNLLILSAFCFSGESKISQGSPTPRTQTIITGRNEVRPR